MIEFGREVCGQPAVAEAREWLVTNGIGGFAMGTISGILTRRYHGLLIAALKPPVGRTLLLAKLDENVSYAGHAYDLFANRWADGTVEQAGLNSLERFHLDGAMPVWTYAFADAQLEKCIWMSPGENTTYIRYTFRRGSVPLEFSAKAIVNHRDYHSTTIRNGWRPQVEQVSDGLRITAFEGATPLHLLSRRATVYPERTWYEDYFLAVEEFRGQNDVVEDHLRVGVFKATLLPGESLTIVASTQPQPDLDGAVAYQKRKDCEVDLLAQAPASPEPLPAQLLLAADQFIVRRAAPQNPNGRTVIAGYPWFSDWGRDTMISLPGLMLTTGRPAIAATVLRTFANYVDQGMLPNRFPDAGEAPEYNTADATLWYFEAIRAYLEATQDETLLPELYPVLEEIIRWHRQGTRYQIGLQDDGLVYAGEEGVQLTWMDAKVDDWVVTPRQGKPVEINALWYNALCCMTAFARRLSQDPAQYDDLAAKARAGFARFWNEAAGYCYDLLDGPDGHDDALRPNQLFAVSLLYSPLSFRKQKAIVDICAQRLLTSYGLRSLDAGHPDYQGDYAGDQTRRDGAYHQGTVWGWLMGPFVMAHLRIYRDKALARSFLQPLLQHLYDHGVGSVSEIFEGDAPFSPRGCPAQAWSVAELLRAWQATAHATD